MYIIKIIKNHLKFIDTITTKLLTLVLFITVIPLMVVANLSTSIINQSMLDSSRNELNFNTLLSTQKYKEGLDSLKLIAAQATKGYLKDSYYRYLNDKNQKVFIESIINFKKNSGISFCLLLDNDNKLVVESDKLNKQKTKQSLIKLIDQAFKGQTVASTEILSNITYFSNLKNKDQLSKEINLSEFSQVVAAPILDEKEKVKAVLLIGKSLVNNNEIPNLIKTMTGATLNIYEVMEKELKIITTNLDLKDNLKSRKIPINNDFFDTTKFNNTYFVKTHHYNKIEIGKNTLINDFLGNTIGIMYIGIPENKFAEPGSNNIKLVGVISVISLIVSILIAALFSRTITTPILKLVIAAKSIAAGYLHQRVEIKGNDEIAQLSTTFNKMADNLEKQEQLRDNFVATLTHDLKVPMLAENQTINYLLKETYGPVTEEQKEVLELIKSTNNSSLEMVSTLLEVYRYDTGNANLLKTRFDIVSLMRDSVDQIKSLTQDKKITISLSSNQDEIFINADEREIKRVLHNLISNAITNGIHRGQILCNIELIQDSKTTYYPKSSTDEYTTLNKPLNISNSILVNIQDDGIGIAREDMGELFKRFSLSKGRKPSGTGLGLYYSYQVITKHKGFIWAESTEGKGSVFRFTLPID